jgi:hypothetical protein
MTEEYADPEFPEMESQPEEFYESEGNPEPEVLEEEFSGEMTIPDELREQVDMELLRSSPEVIYDNFPVSGYPPQEASTNRVPDAGGTLFLPEDDPLQHPLAPVPLDSPPVYTRPVPRRLRHLVCERRGPEYNRPLPGLLQPRGG